MHKYIRHPTSSNFIHAIAMTVALALPGRAACETFCDTWKSVYETANRGFFHWRGAFDSDFGEFASTISFPNSSECSIEEHKDAFQFRCSWKYTSGERDKALAEAQAFSRGIRECLRTRIERNASHDDFQAKDTKGHFIYRDTIKDNSEEARSARVSAYETAESRKSSGRVMPASIQINVYIEYSRDKQ